LDTIGPKRINENKGKKVETVTTETGCIECTSHSLNKDGYVRLFVSKHSKPRMQFLHRIEWEKKYGSVPEGFEIDHVCRNRACCNTDHLQLLTVSEHKIKTNKERYLDRKLKILSDLLEGISIKEIAIKYSVSEATVRRLKRENKELNERKFR